MFTKLALTVLFFIQPPLESGLTQSGAALSDARSSVGQDAEQLSHESESISSVDSAEAQRGHGGGQGRRRQRRGRGGQQGDQAQQADQNLISFLIRNRSKISREVKQRDDGVETLTESDDPKVAEAIRAHVKSMYVRVKSGNGIRLRDPLFRALFSYAGAIDMQAEPTDKGIRVVETSTNAYAVKLIQAHAQVVSLFVKNGPAEVRKNHEAPAK